MIDRLEVVILVFAHSESSAPVAESRDPFRAFGYGLR
jgi:hypothetical protein